MANCGNGLITRANGKAKANAYQISLFIIALNYPSNTIKYLRNMT